MRESSASEVEATQAAAERRPTVVVVVLLLPSFFGQCAQCSLPDSANTAAWLVSSFSALGRSLLCVVASNVIRPARSAHTVVTRLP